MGMNKFFLIVSFLFIYGCNDNKAENLSYDDSYEFVYSDEFEKTFDMESGKNVDLPTGVNALRAYVSKFKYGDTFHLQMYLDDSLDLKLDAEEATFIVYDNSQSGFYGFSGAKGFSDDKKNKIFSDWQQKQSDDYGWLFISYSETLIMSGGMMRYTKKLIPGYTLIEVMLSGPDVEAIYLFTGDTPPSSYKEIIDITNKLSDTDDLSQDGYLKIPLPEEIQTFYMNNCGDLCPP